MRRAALLLVLAAALAWAVSRGAPPERRTLRVFAAASLREAFTQLARGFEREHPGVRVELSFAGSQALRVQIEQGAPADIFASADRAQMQPLAQAGLVRGVSVLAHNRLVVAVPQGGAVQSLSGLAAPRVRLVLAAPEVPAGRYAGQILDRLDRSDLFGPHFARRARANIVSRETNVRAVLAKVALGEADAGIVYATDLSAAGGRARAIPIPDNCNVVAEYPIATVAASSEPELARAFVAAARGPRGRAILARHGFAP